MDIQQQIEEQTNRIKEQKNELIMRALAVYGHYINIEEMQGARFKPLVVEEYKVSDYETIDKYYYNDGSKDGLLFLTLKNTMSVEETKEGAFMKHEVKIVQDTESRFEFPAGSVVAINPYFDWGTKLIFKEKHNLTQAHEITIENSENYNGAYRVGISSERTIVINKAFKPEIPKNWTAKAESIIK